MTVKYLLSKSAHLVSQLRTGLLGLGYLEELIKLVGFLKSKLQDIVFEAHIFFQRYHCELHFARHFFFFLDDYEHF